MLEWHTSVNLEHIFEMASRTSICDSVKPEVSIIRRPDVTENALRSGCVLEIRGNERVHIGRRSLLVDAIARLRCDEERNEYLRKDIC